MVVKLHVYNYVSLINFCTLSGPCDNLPPLFNGMITYNTSQGLQNTVATYTCNDGSTLLGSKLRICEDGVWEEASPSCLQESKLCLNCMNYCVCACL